MSIKRDALELILLDTSDTLRRVPVEGILKEINLYGEAHYVMPCVINKFEIEIVIREKE